MFERRKKSRFSRRFPVFVEISSRGAAGDYPRRQIIKGYTTDISRFGFQLVTSRRLQSNAQLRLYMLNNTEHPLDLLGEVRWLAQDSEHWRIGFELMDARGTDYLLWQNDISRASLDLVAVPATGKAGA